MRRLFFLIVLCVLLIVGVGAASAGPSPDGQQTTSTSPQQILLTPYFALGEVDLSSLGVTPTALLLGPGPWTCPVPVSSPSLSSR